MAINKTPPRIDENDLRGSVRQMSEYLFYLREQIQYEIDLINKKVEVTDNGKKEL